MYKEKKILIVDDKPDSASAFCEVLSEDGYDVHKAPNVEKAIDTIQRNNISAIITDAGMHYRNRTQLFEYITEHHPDIPVVLLMSCGTDEWAYPSKIHNAFCYVERSPDYICLKTILARAVEQHSLKNELKYLKKNLTDENIRYRIIGNSVEMSKVSDVIEAVKNSNSNVIIYGETGTGKELIARAINNLGEKDGLFIPVNCAAMPKELIEAELFGWDKDIYPWVFSRRTGKIEEAARGTMFLDEIGDLEPSLQAKLFKVIQEKDHQPPGSSRKTKILFRLISSTKRDLKQKVRDGNFREDLFRKISRIEIFVPPLRERKDDIPLLVSAFVNEFCEKEKKVLTVSDKLMKAFESYDWPGNVRQIRNVLERAVILATGDKITLKEISEGLLSCKKKAANTNTLRTFKELETEILKNTLRTCKGNKSKASRILGISRKAMYNRLKEVGTENSHFPEKAIFTVNRKTAGDRIGEVREE